MLDYKMTVKQLKVECKVRGIRRYSKLRKAELIILLQADDRVEEKLHQDRSLTPKSLRTIEELLLLPPSEFRELTEVMGITQFPNEYIGEFYVRVWDAYPTYKKEVNQEKLEFFNNLEETLILLPTKEAKQIIERVYSTYGVKLKIKSYRYYSKDKGDGLLKTESGDKYSVVSTHRYAKFDAYNPLFGAYEVECFSQSEVDYFLNNAIQDDDVVYETTFDGFKPYGRRY